MEFKVDERIKFDKKLQTLEVDFSGLEFRSASDIDETYDVIQSEITKSGHDFWYFAVNYKDCKIALPASPAHSRRGSRINVMHSIGTVRYDASQKTASAIASRPGQGVLQGNFFSSREDALAEISAMRSKQPEARNRGKLAPSKYSADDFKPLVGFLEDLQVLDVNLTDISFDNANDVNTFYDHVEEQVKATGKKWYFLVNYSNCKISMRAWVTYAQRGKKLNIASSLGSVRYDATPEFEAEIRSQASTGEFRANIARRREDALGMIEKMKSKAE